MQAPATPTATCCTNGSRGQLGMTAAAEASATKGNTAARATAQLMIIHLEGTFLLNIPPRPKPMLANQVQ